MVAPSLTMLNPDVIIKRPINEFQSLGLGEMEIVCADCGCLVHRGV